MKEHNEQLSPLESEFIKASQNVKKREQLRWVGIAVAGVTLLLMVVLGVTGKLNRFIYRPVDMEDYWVTIPAGEFQMGSDTGNDDEKPVHAVYLDEYQIGKYEITNRQFDQCARAQICDKTTFDEAKALHPVVNVYWFNANKYCEYVGGRLPSEAEWEKAASWDDEAKTKRTYPWGETIDCTYANYYGKDGGNDYCVGDTTPVGSYEGGKSPYGLYNMAGNAWEWVSSLYMPYPFDANDGREDMSSADPRVLRGGAWNDLVDYGRSASRSSGYPAASNFYVSFRCSRSLP